MEPNIKGCRRWLQAVGLACMALALPTSAQSPSPHPDMVVGEQHTARGELIHLTNGTLRISLCETGIELRIYPGTDGDTTLYSDDGLTYAYEKGQYARIPMHWNDASRTLTVAERQGHLAGHSASREFHVLLVTPRYGTGEAVAQGGSHLAYTGGTKQMRFQK
jgi:hypothetical protein